LNVLVTQAGREHDDGKTPQDWMGPNVAQNFDAIGDGEWAEFDQAVGDLLGTRHPALRTGQREHLVLQRVGDTGGRGASDRLDHREEVVPARFQPRLRCGHLDTAIWSGESQAITGHGLDHPGEPAAGRRVLEQPLGDGVRFRQHVLADHGHAQVAADPQVQVAYLGTE